MTTSFRVPFAGTLAAAFVTALVTMSLSAALARAEAPPSHVSQKSPSQAFSRNFEFALNDGRVWFQPAGARDAWTLFGGTGLPDDAEARSIIAISADGDSLVAVTPERRVFDAEISNDKSGALKIKWNKGWGWPLRAVAKKLYLPEGNLGFAASIVSAGNAVFQNDPAGNPHQILGINTLYVLAPGGQEIRFDDPWLPPNDFQFHFATPDHGRVKAVSLSASGSTVFISDRAGRLFTRVIDFDTLGGNPGIAYSYNVRGNAGLKGEGFWASARTHVPFLLDLRKLPGDTWHEHSRVTLADGSPARITSRLTILTDGKGNDARQLRVEGTARIDGRDRTGYFHKSIAPLTGAWTFEPTDEPLAGTPLEQSVVAELGARRGESHDGEAQLYDTAYRLAPTRVVPARIEDFNLDFDLATVTLELAPGAKVSLPLALEARIFAPGASAWLTGALLIPREKRARAAQDFVSDWLFDQPSMPVRVYLTPGMIELQLNRAQAASRNSLVLRFPRK